MKAKRGKLFTGVRPIGGKAIKSRRIARQVTSSYHAIRNEMEALGDKDKKRHAELSSQLVALGGTDAYQQASVTSTAHFKTSRWVLAMVAKHCSPRPKGQKLDVLEVGAINTQLFSASHLNVRAIDVNSQHPRIEEIDFFDILPTQSYDCVVSSMVVNCVTRAGGRGDMLARLAGHLRDETSLLLLALPTRCVNSPLLGSEALALLLRGLGLLVLETRLTPKVTFFTLRLSSPPNADAGAGYVETCRSRLALLSKADLRALQATFKTQSSSSSSSSQPSIPTSNSSTFQISLCDEFWP